MVDLGWRVIVVILTRRKGEFANFRETSQGYSTLAGVRSMNLFNERITHLNMFNEPPTNNKSWEPASAKCALRCAP